MTTLARTTRASSSSQAKPAHSASEQPQGKPLALVGSLRDWLIFRLQGMQRHELLDQPLLIGEQLIDPLVLPQDHPDGDHDIWSAGDQGREGSSNGSIHQGAAGSAVNSNVNAPILLNRCTELMFVPSAGIGLNSGQPVVDAWKSENVIAPPVNTLSV